MRKSVAILLDEAKGKMSGYVALTNYRYMNLCINAEPAALLSVNVELYETTYKLEDVANISNPQKDQFAIFPKEINPELTFAISKGVKTVHPEFKLEVKNLDENNGEEDNVDSDNNDEDTEKYILLTMPKVNKDRHDVIVNGVDTLQKACQAKLDLLLQQYTQSIIAKLTKVAPNEIDEGKENLQGLYDEHKKLLNSFSDKKKAEVEEAYQLYLAGKQEEEAKQQEQDEAHGKDKGMSLQMSDDADE